MKLSFRVKMGLVISAVAVGITGVSVFSLYNTTRSNMLRLMGDRLKDMGRTGSMMFGAQERRDIQLLSAMIRRDQLPTEGILEAVAKSGQGDYDVTLDPAVAERFHSTPEFQRLIQVLRLIKHGSRNKVLVPRRLEQAPIEYKDDPPLLSYVYLFVTAPGLQREPDPPRFVEFLGRYGMESFGRWLADLFNIPDRQYAVYRFVADADYAQADWNYDGKIDEDEAELVNSIGNFYVSDTAIQPFFVRAFEGQVAAGDDFYVEEWGTLFSAAIPIMDAKGEEVIAVLGLDYNALSEANEVTYIRNISIGTIIGAMIISVIVALLLANALNKPIKILREGAERVADRDFDTHIVVDTKDEFGLLANTFNGMVDEIREYAHGLEELSNAYYRFVPREFLTHLERESIVDVKLGDQVQREMTVLFSDIRSFTTLSEGMTPRDNFNFLNGYLGNVSPIIRQHNGFIDKYIGDAVMALFPGRCEDAIDTAVAMHTQLRDYNEYRQREGFAAIKIGVGLHSGNLMLGTVGEEKRMESTVISDAVNLASRLEGLTKKFGAAVIVSERVKNDSRKSYDFRYLGKVRVKGKHASQKVFEVLDAEPEDLRTLKIQTMARFEAGVDAFQHGNYEEARTIFEEVETTNPGDRAAHAYIEHCVRFIKQAS